jgi:quinol-cytochrome oxidoreductase complex cytochrome b subunit/Fe-S-cluster-containing hydrogenase component 2
MKGCDVAEDPQIVFNNLSSELTLVQESDTRPLVSGEYILLPVENLFLRLINMTSGCISRDMNPLLQLGAVANSMFLISTITGIAMLIWYDSSVHLAYQSLENIKNSSHLAQLMRSLHRYSSDACILFILLHIVEVLGGRKISSTRWLPWVTGGLALFLLWFDGWLGYWLTWDVRAQQIALGTAKLLDTLPIFADPLSRSFVADATINSLLFFVVFFIHMLIPLAVGIGLWLHVTNLNKAKFFTNQRLSMALIFILCLVSLAFPAYSAEPANMAKLPSNLPIDWFYMPFLLLTENFSSGSIWFIGILSSLIFITLPWLITKEKDEKPFIEASSCGGCSSCFEDCPYGAIDMISGAKNEHGKHASIDSEKCVNCGICVGSCTFGSVQFPSLTFKEARERIRGWLKNNTDMKANDEENYIAFLCSNSAASHFKYDPITGICEDLPGYRVMAVPCAGWVGPNIIRSSGRLGASGILIVGCGPENPIFRLGPTLVDQRLKDHKEAVFREPDKIPVGLITFNRMSPGKFLKAAQEFRAAGSIKPRQIGALKRFLVNFFLIGTLSAGTVLFSNLPYPNPAPQTGFFVFSFKYPGSVMEISKASEEHNKNKLAHMRTPVHMGRERNPVKVRIVLDGKIVLEKSYEPRGLFNDGNSIALERFPLASGQHLVEVFLSDSAVEDWKFHEKQSFEVQAGKIKALGFNKLEGFLWY